jgi:hypothetical protein
VHFRHPAADPFADFFEKDFPDTLGLFRDETIEAKLSLRLTRIMLAQPGNSDRTNASVHFAGG